MTSRHCHRRERLRTLPGYPVLLLGALLAPAAHAQQAAPPPRSDDQVWVMTRAVTPRTAYRGPAPEEHPPLAQVVLFPGRVFHATLEGMALDALDDQALGERGSVGVLPASVPATGLAGMSASPAPAMATAVGGVPAGMAAQSIGGTVSRATAGVDAAIHQALAPLVSAGGPGGGP